MRTLYRNALVHTPAHPSATALLVDGDRIEWLGDNEDAPPADTTVDAEGGLILPAFVDAHVHLTDTGLAITGLDLSETRSATALLEAVERHARTIPEDSVVLGHGWDETRWPDRRPPSAAALDRAGGGRPVYLSRVDAHSALASTALLAAGYAGDGFDPSGWLRHEAHHAIRTIALGSVGTPQRRSAQSAALQAAAAVGIAALCECGGPDVSDDSDFAQALSWREETGVPEVFGLWGELGSADKARQMGAIGAGGDLFADGAVGSRTAHLRLPYRDGDGVGRGYLTGEQVRDHVIGCVREGIQASFHAIGDAALDTVLSGFVAAGRIVGRDRLRAGHHRVEHAEMPDRRQIATMVACGLIASVQPAFDRLWGGGSGMYAARLGSSRALAMNPFADMAGVGVTLAFGSDSPVTQLDPWGAVAAAMEHHTVSQRLARRAAFAAHTRGGWRSLGREEDGLLVPGGLATFAVWRTPEGVLGGLPRLLASDPVPGGIPEPDADPPERPVCLRTVCRGEVIFEGPLTGGAQR